MNFQVKTIFDDIRSDIAFYKADVTGILRNYAADAAKAASAAEAYKDAESELAKRKAALVAAARPRIEAADKRLHDRLTANVEKLQKQMTAYVSARPDAEFVAHLRDVRDFGLKLSGTEVRALVEQTKGCYLGLRFVQRVAAQSSFKVDFPSVEDFENDLRTISVAAWLPVQWCDSHDVAAASEVFSDVPVRRDDGSVAYFAGRPSSVQLSISSRRVDHLENMTGKMAERWERSLIPDVKAVAQMVGSGEEGAAEKDEIAAAIVRQAERSATDCVDVAENSEVSLAAAERIAAQNAEAKTQSAAILARYL